MEGVAEGKGKERKPGKGKGRGGEGGRGKVTLVVKGKISSEWGTNKGILMGKTFLRPLWSLWAINREITTSLMKAFLRERERERERMCRCLTLTF